MLACIIVGSIVSALIGGRISDRVGRKPVIYVAGAAMAAAALLLLVAPSYPVALGLALFFGLGFGAFTSVDWALGSDAMPSASSYARDMGIWHVAFVAPQMTSAPQERCWTGATHAATTSATRWCSASRPCFSSRGAAGPQGAGQRAPHAAGGGVMQGAYPPCRLP